MASKVGCRFENLNKVGLGQKDLLLVCKLQAMGNMLMTAPLFASTAYDSWFADICYNWS